MINLDKKDFLDVEQYLENEYPITCIVSDRGLGKTHSSIARVEQHCLTRNAKFVIVRLTYEVFKKFKDDLESSREGWKCSFASQNIKKDGEIIGYLASLNTYANAKGGTYNDVEYMVFDEFNEDVYIENAYAKFVMLVDSFKRHRKNFKCILLGNMINKNNWFLNAMGLRIDWKCEDDKIYYLPEYGVKVVVVGSKTFEKLTNARKDISKLASADPSAHAFYNEREFLNDETCLVTNFVKWVQPTFQPLFYFRLKEFKYIFGRYLEENGKVHFFVDRYNIHFKNYQGLAEFGFDGLGASSSKESQVIEDDDLLDFQKHFFVLTKQQKLMFGSFDAYEDLKMFIALGSWI